MPERAVRAVAALAVAVILGSACGSGGPTPGDTGNGSASGGPIDGRTDGPGGACAFDGTRREYDGSADVDLSYADPIGETYARSYTHEAGVELGPPAEDGALREDNPLHVDFGTVDQLLQGTFAGLSAVSHTDPDDGRTELIRFWSLTADCDRLTGTLTDSRSAEGFDVANQVYAQRSIGPGLGFMDWFFRMANGTTLEASVTRESLELTVAGHDVERRLEFTIALTATLV